MQFFKVFPYRIAGLDVLQHQQPPDKSLMQNPSNMNAVSKHTKQDSMFQHLPSNAKSNPDSQDFFLESQDCWHKVKHIKIYRYNFKKLSKQFISNQCQSDGSVISGKNRSPSLNFFVAKKKKKKNKK